MTDEILTIEPHINLHKIEIWQPRYSTGDVLVQKAKVQEHNVIVFTKAKHLAGKEFYLSKLKVKAKKYPTQDNGGKPVYIIPMSDLKECKQARAW